MSVLVFCEHNEGKFTKTAYELLSKAKSLVGDVGGSVHAVVIGDVDVSSLATYGADTIYTATGEDFRALNTGVATKVLQTAAEKCQPKLVLGASSPAGKDILPRLAIRMNAGFAPELVELVYADGSLVGTRPCFTGKVYHDVRISTAAQVYTVRPNAFSVEENAGAGNVETLSVELSDFETSFKVVDVQVSEVEYIDLTEADRIVSGGRSVKSKEQYDALIRPLAKSLGATAGASRAAVDLGFAEHSEQVGQTGKIVNPSLYFACGISGAIQHLAGMRTSRIIVAINTDKDAPIFSHANYGIVADMFDVCPLLTAAFSSGDTVSVAPKAEKPAAKEAPKKAAPVQKEAPAQKKEAPKAEKPAVQEAPKKTAPVQKSVEKAPGHKKEAVPSVASAPVASVPTGSVVASFDPSLLHGLESQITNLNAELTNVKAELKVKNDISAVKSDMMKAIADAQKATKSDVDRIEKNARSFQEGGLKRFDDVNSTVSTEVRKVREVLREGIRNETDYLRSQVSSLRAAVVAVVVLNAMILFLMLVILVKMLML